jgi:hypothetical protein
LCPWKDKTYSTTWDCPYSRCDICRLATSRRGVRFFGTNQAIFDLVHDTASGRGREDVVSIDAAAANWVVNAIAWRSGTSIFRSQ